jgi:hypothetical protein
VVPACRPRRRRRTFELAPAISDDAHATVHVLAPGRRSHGRQRSCLGAQAGFSKTACGRIDYSVDIALRSVRVNRALVSRIPPARRRPNPDPRRAWLFNPVSRRLRLHPRDRDLAFPLSLRPPAIDELFVFLSHSPAIEVLTSCAHPPSALPLTWF